jgi:hypothetical protein
MDDFGNALNGILVQEDFGDSVFAIGLEEQFQRSISANPYGGSEEGFCSYVI